MIEFNGVSKTYPGSEEPVVDSLSMEITEGEICVLVGPSGCGKTTTLRMINRMVEHTQGRLLVEGEDVKEVDAAQLRRRIGYVIQEVGLFPHRTIAQNVATVPGLIGWSKEQLRARSEELMTMVGLSPETAERYPHQLSGGQQQRVGVARALAADPAIMLMDEPFGAVDPIVREDLQDEFLRLQRELHKTIVFVTHDIDEAIKMGDRIAIFREGGVLAQYAPPAELLSNPADQFVADFLGAERELKLLALFQCSSIGMSNGPIVSPDDTAAHAAEEAQSYDESWVVVGDGEAEPQGWLPVSELDGLGGVSEGQLRSVPVLEGHAHLRFALNAMLSSQSPLVAIVDGEGRYKGLITRDALTGEIQRSLAGEGASEDSELVVTEAEPTSGTKTEGG